MIRTAAFALTISGALAFSPGAAADGGPPVASSPREIRPALIGASLPDLSLTTGDGSAFDLRAAVSKKAAVLVFYRGGW